MTGTIFRVERFAIHDGPGIRTTVFLKGCPLRCAWCHSPESQSPRPEFMPLADRCIGCGRCRHACGVTSVSDPTSVKKATLAEVTPEACTVCGACARACPTGARVLVGEETSVEAVLATLERDRIFYDESGGGVTLSGGEPLMQAAFVAALVQECRARRIHVAVDTSGFGDPRALDDIRPDLFLFDVKAVDDARHKAMTGVSNRVILENLERLAGGARASGAGVIVRFPLVPGLTDGDDNVRDVGRLVSSLGIARLDVLPYHRAGLAKYERLGRPYPMGNTAPPTSDEIDRAARTLSAAGLDVLVGGA